MSAEVGSWRSRFLLAWVYLQRKPGQKGRVYGRSKQECFLGRKQWDLRHMLWHSRRLDLGMNIQAVVIQLLKKNIKQCRTCSQRPTGEPQKSVETIPPQEDKDSSQQKWNNFCSCQALAREVWGNSVYKRMSFSSVQIYKHWSTSEPWSRRHFHFFPQQRLHTLQGQN